LGKSMDDGLLILGYYDPASGEVDIQIPLERTEYVEKRLAEVIGG